MDRTTTPNGLTEVEKLASRWDKIAFRVQGSPFEDLSISCLAKNVGTRAWSRPGGRVKGDTVARYIYFSFEELLEVEKLDIKSATLLLEICEALFLMEEEYDDLGSFEEIDKQASQQRLRFVEEFGLYQDFPVALSNLDADLRELCRSEGIETFVQLMEFLDRLSDKAMIGGSYQKLQNVFAHGDEKGLSTFFPYRIGYRGFHLPETLSFVLNHLPGEALEHLLEYHERRRRPKRLGVRRIQMPAIVEDKLLPEFFSCLCYFGRRQPKLLMRLHDSAYLCRELMHLHDPQVEGVLHWLVHLSLGVFQPRQFAERAGLQSEIDSVQLPSGNDSVKELRRLLDEEVGTGS